MLRLITYDHAIYPMFRYNYIQSFYNKYYRKNNWSVKRLLKYEQKREDPRNNTYKAYKSTKRRRR